MADKIESSAPSPVETKTATYMGSQQRDSASDEHDPEKQAVSERPELQRKLKSRHLQMIAIGVSTLARLVFLTHERQVVQLELVCSLEAVVLLRRLAQQELSLRTFSLEPLFTVSSLLSEKW